MDQDGDDTNDSDISDDDTSKDLLFPSNEHTKYEYDAKVDNINNTNDEETTYSY